jgi:hypothetical protein
MAKLKNYEDIIRWRSHRHGVPVIRGTGFIGLVFGARKREISILSPELPPELPELRCPRNCPELSPELPMKAQPRAARRQPHVLEIIALQNFALTD